MTAGSARRALTGGVGLLERATGYTLGSLRLVRPEVMSRPTPCAAWDLRALLSHMNDSLLALHEAMAEARVGIGPDGDFGDPAVDPVACLRNRACHMLGEWVGSPDPCAVAVADRTVSAEIIAVAGALEVTVHGWDVARACGYDRPVPPALAEELLDLAPLLVRTSDRPVRFAQPVRVSPLATFGERLVAFMGRDPRWGMPLQKVGSSAMTSRAGRGLSGDNANSEREGTPMSTKIFVNLPVTDLTKSTDFYSALGYKVNPQFTDENAACIVISDDIFVMLLRREFYQTFTSKEICDATTHSETLLALSAESREAVDTLVKTALANGGSPAREPMDHGFMYGWSFQDPDGHTWEPLWMDPAHVEG